MATDVSSSSSIIRPPDIPSPTANPCCTKWMTRYTKMEEKRNALRQGVELLKAQIDRLELENSNIKKACDEERARVSLVEEERGREALLRKSLEEENAALKAQLSSSRPEGVSENEDLSKEVTLLREQISKREEEISRLKHSLSDEERRADSEKKCAEFERKKAADLQVAFDCEKNKGEEASKVFEALKKETEECKCQLETLKKEHDKTRLKCEQVSKKLEGEKQKCTKEKRRADEEKARAIELRKIADTHEKKVAAERSHAERLSKQLQEQIHKVDSLQKELQVVLVSQKSVDPLELDEVKRNLEAEKMKFMSEKKRADSEMRGTLEQMKVAEANAKKAAEEKWRAHKLSQEILSKTRRIEELEKELYEMNTVLAAERERALSEEKRADSEKSKFEELERTAAETERRAVEEKVRADNLVENLEESGRKLKICENELNELKLCQNLRGPSGATSQIVANEQTAELNLLRKQVKFEKQRVKHAKEVATYEKGRSSILQQQLSKLRRNMGCLLDQMDVLGDVFGPGNGVDDVSKMSGLSNVQTGKLCGKAAGRPSHMYLCDDTERKLCSLSSRDVSYQKDNKESVEPKDNTKSPSGMPTESGPLLGGPCGESLPSSALNLNTASFSDEQLVGSQERIGDSLTTPTAMAVEKENAQAAVSKWSDEHDKRKDVNEIGEFTEFEIPSGRVKKRRKILDEYECIRSMHSESKRICQEVENKLCALHNRLVEPAMEQTEKEASPLSMCKVNSSCDIDKLNKKRKASHVLKPTIERVDKFKEQLGTDELEGATLNATKRLKIIEISEDTDREPVKFNQNALVSFEEMMNGNYMKLLDLDDAVQEECFRMAMQRPLTPTLPDIDFPETGSWLNSSNTPVTTMNEVTGDHLGVSAQRRNVVCCIVFSDMEDAAVITNIFHATKTCIARCSVMPFASLPLLDILAAVELEKDLTPREKVCVLFSLILFNYSAFTFTKLEDIHTLQQLDSFSAHIHSALCDAKARDVFARVCDSNELVGLLLDFLLRRILFQNIVMSDSLEESTSKFEIVHAGEKYFLSPCTAPSNLVISGSIVLAILCKVFGFTASLCDVSLNLLYIHGADDELVLTILHIFAHICGEEYLTNSNYSLVMNVVKSLVRFVELDSSSNDDMGLLPGNATQPRVCPYDRCLFSEGSLSIHDAFSMVFEELERFTMLHGAVEEDVKYLDDVLLSLELIALKMGWNSSCDKLTVKLSKMLECRDSVRCSFLVIGLVGKLGRFGVEACGYDDTRVASLRHQLICIFCEAVNSNCNSVLVGMVASALIGLFPMGSLEVTNCFEHLLLTSGHSSSAAPGVMSAWISSLASEHVSSLFSLEHSVVAS